MIINGGSRRAGGWWAQHLGNGKDNERVSLVEMVGLDATTVPDAFREMLALARNSGSKAENYFYQANINPRAEELLTPAQRHEAKELLLKNLSLAGQPHFVVEHEKEGRVHTHVIAFRIDLEQSRAISDSLTAAIHERTARELEIKFDLERGQSILVPDRDFERPERRPKKFEVFRGAESGIDPATVAAEIKPLWERSDCGQAFRAALEASGRYVLAAGDRRDYLIVDCAGDEHSLTRRVGAKAKDVRERMADIDRADLPNVAEARAMQRERHHEQTIIAAEIVPMPAPEEAFAATAARVTELQATNWDRDAADIAWLDRVAAAGIAADAGKEENIQPPVIQAGEHGIPAAEQPTPPPREFAPEPEDGLRSVEGIGDRILGGAGRLLTALFDFAANCIAPPPPPTKVQAMRAALVAEEKQEARAEHAAQQQKVTAQDWLIAELQRQQQAREREEEETYTQQRRRSHSL